LRGYPRTHQQCFSGNNTVPLGLYCTMYQLVQRRWSNRGLTSMRGGTCENDGPSPPTIGACALAGNGAPTTNKDERQANKASDLAADFAAINVWLRSRA
jgi:hypothetical protein